MNWRRIAKLSFKLTLSAGGKVQPKRLLAGSKQTSYSISNAGFKGVKVGHALRVAGNGINPKLYPIARKPKVQYQGACWSMITTEMAQHL